MKKIISLVVFAIAFAAEADWSPIGISLFTPASFPPSEADVKGIRLNVIYGRCMDMYGVDVGIANHVRGDLVGVQYGCCGFVCGNLGGVQVNDANFVLQNGCGLEVGWYNDCRGSFYGLQLGAVNLAQDMCGVQIGIVNIIKQSSLRFFPIVNAKF